LHAGGNFPARNRVETIEPVNDDKSLIEQTLAGDSAAFGRLVRKYQDRLYNTMVHVVGRGDDAMDVVQDAFVQAFVKLDSFKQNAAFYTWLYRIAFNVASTYRRKRKPTLSVDRVREASGEEPIEPGIGPADKMEQDERCRQVRAAIAGLTEEHRTVIVLREIDGCCYETIAEILDLPVGTVRSRLHRARLQLKELLREVLMLDD
jgi:RNA polymerase sigma-70 factor (ECF subfamily)